MPEPVDYDTYPEMNYFNKDEFERQIMLQCAGKQRCQASIPTSAVVDVHGDDQPL